jgi:hypothetical protein
MLSLFIEGINNIEDESLGQYFSCFLVLKEISFAVKENQVNTLSEQASHRLIFP